MKRQIASLKSCAQKGFTVIELMIVMTVIAVLTAYALPAFQDYTIRTRVAEGLALATSAKTAMTEYYTTNHTWPADNTTAGMADGNQITGNAVTSVTIEPYKIKVVYKSNVGDSNHNLVVFEAPSSPIQGEAVTWKCGASGTTVPIQFLPLECR